VAHAGENAKSPASVGISSLSSQANLPDLLVVVILFILLDFFILVLDIVVIEVVVVRWKEQVKREGSPHGLRDAGPCG